MAITATLKENSHYAYCCVLQRNMMPKLLV